MRTPKPTLALAGLVVRSRAIAALTASPVASFWSAVGSSLATTSPSPSPRSSGRCGSTRERGRCPGSS